MERQVHLLGSEGVGKSFIAYQLAKQFWGPKPAGLSSVNVEDTYLQLLPLDLRNHILQVLDRQFTLPSDFDPTTPIYLRQFRYRKRWVSLQLHDDGHPPNDRSCTVIIVYDPTTGEDLRTYIEKHYRSIQLTEAPIPRAVTVFLSKIELISERQLLQLRSAAQEMIDTIGSRSIGFHEVSAVSGFNLEAALLDALLRQRSYSQPVLRMETFGHKIKRKRRTFILMTCYLLLFLISITAIIFSSSS
eukprot:TRINITY_DN8222_c0_g2_i3.p1 TRINITY_DN8222_c0_g2~~TRINITY_DN8222_c0_g2_i3.p1  ORF type:complete len:245 (+),score=26.60 TRINITY_DN8222_c0_g2_i3:259-993(+)